MNNSSNEDRNDSSDEEQAPRNAPEGQSSPKHSDSSAHHDDADPFAAAPHTPKNANRPSAPGEGSAAGEIGPYHHPAPSGLSFGAKLAIGIVIGVFLAILLLFGVLFIGVAAGLEAGLFIALLVPSVIGALMFSEKIKPYATGILIILAATWLIIIGPCLLIITDTS